MEVYLVDIYMEVYLVDIYMEVYLVAIYGSLFGSFKDTMVLILA